MKALLFIFVLFFIGNTPELHAQTPSTSANKHVKGKRGKRTKAVKLHNPSAMKGIEYKPLEFKKAAQHKKGGAIVHHGKKVVGNIRSVAGFRICVYQGIDRKQALEIKRSFLLGEEKLNSYISYHRPNYHIRVGDFETKKDAERFLKRLQKKYPGCYVAPDIVTVKNLQVKKARRKTRR